MKYCLHNNFSVIEDLHCIILILQYIFNTKISRPTVLYSFCTSEDRVDCGECAGWQTHSLTDQFNVRELLGQYCRFFTHTLNVDLHRAWHGAMMSITNSDWHLNTQ